MFYPLYLACFVHNCAFSMRYWYWLGLNVDTGDFILLLKHIEWLWSNSKQNRAKLMKFSNFMFIFVSQTVFASGYQEKDNTVMFIEAEPCEKEKLNTHPCFKSYARVHLIHGCALDHVWFWKFIMKFNLVYRYLHTHVRGCVWLKNPIKPYLRIRA